MTHDQERIAALLSDEPMTADEIADDLGITDDRALASLRYLESAGLAARATTDKGKPWVAGINNNGADGA